MRTNQILSKTRENKFLTKEQFKIVKYVYKKPRTFKQIRQKLHVSPDELRFLFHGIWDYISHSESPLSDTVLISIRPRGKALVENSHFFDLEYFLSHILIPILVGIISAVITACIVG